MYKIKSILLAGALLTAPLAVAMAQTESPTGNMGSNRSATASPGTADGSGMSTGDVSSKPRRPIGSAMSSTTPGATGQTVVPGSNSSPARASAGTAGQKTGAGAEGGGK
jgi:hypothetical protein